MRQAVLALTGSVCIAVSALHAPTAQAHSGGLDSNGCHAGSQPYHCHRAPSDMVGNRLRCDLGSRSSECENGTDAGSRPQDESTSWWDSRARGTDSDSGEQVGIKGIMLGAALGNIAEEVGFAPESCPESDSDLHIGTVCAPGSAYSVALEDCYISSLYFWNGGTREADPPLDGALYRASLTCPSSGFEYVEEALSKKFGSSPTVEQGDSFMRWVWKFRDDKVVYLSRLGSYGTSRSNKFTIGLVDYRLQQAYNNYREAALRMGRDQDI